MTTNHASAAYRRRERMYREYMEFFDKGERTRRWHPMDDVPWDLLAPPRHDPAGGDGAAASDAEEAARCLETFCAVELFIPDYTKNGLNLSREIFGQAWFHLAWGFEESKHALTFREYLLRSGLRSEAQYMQFEQRILEKEWDLPFHSARQMACYGALQEIATFLIYSHQKEKYAAGKNPVLYRIFDLVARDEAAHTSFYRRFLQYELEEDRAGALADLSYVVNQFEMPGRQLLPDYEERLATAGVGISSRDFLIRGIMPTLHHLGVSRSDLVRAAAAYRNTGRHAAWQSRLANGG